MNVLEDFGCESESDMGLGVDTVEKVEVCFFVGVFDLVEMGDYEDTGSRIMGHSEGGGVGEVFGTIE